MGVQILQGDALPVLRTLEAESVHACITSPPFWALRDYGCPGQIGLEETPAQYVETLVAVFREVRRVLRRDGTLWLNLGDTYAGSRCGPAGDGVTGRHVVQSDDFVKSKRQGARWGGGDIAVPNLPAKNLIGIPWRVAFALQDDGWILRSDIVWAKANPMPESVQDRPTRSHEFVFLLTRSAEYYYDAAAIREPLRESSLDRINQPTFDRQTGGPKDYGHGTNGNRSVRGALEHLRDKQRGHARPHAGFNARWDSMSRAEQQANGANKRDVWTVATQPFPGAHFATFPERLIEPCVLAGCPAGGVVLDPFAGSGTTGRVALRHGRNAILIELNPEYVELCGQRTSSVPVLLPLHTGEQESVTAYHEEVG